MLKICEDTIERDMSYYSFSNDTTEDGGTPKVETPAHILRDVCPADCYEQGTCVDGMSYIVIN